MSEPETFADDETPNERGALLTYADDFDDWQWKDRDAITNISANAVRQYLKELSNDVGFVIYPSDNGGQVILTGLRADFQIETDLGALLREFATHTWSDDEKADFRRMLQDVLRLC